MSIKKLKLIGLSGSLRKRSYNRSALEAIKLLSVNTLDISIVSLADLPLFNPDLDDDSIPAVLTLKSRLKHADGLIISSPEYAHGISGVMKNALDWLVSGDEFVNLPIMLINTSPRASHAQQMLREVVTTMSGNILEQACVAIPLLGSGFDAQKVAVDPQLSQLLRTASEQFYLGITARDY